MRLIEKYRFHLLMPKAELDRLLAEGKARTFHLAGKKVCVGRWNNELFAMNDKCPHQGASLGGGECLEGGLIECPWHKYRFDMHTGREKTGTGEAVRIYKVDEREEGVFIGFPYMDFTWRS